MVGYYGGRTIKDGQHGQYEVVLIHVPMGQSYMLSGSQLIQLLDASMAQPGHPIRIVWKGYTQTAAGYNMKTFDVMVAQGEVIPLGALPSTSREEARERLKVVAEEEAPIEEPKPDPKRVASASQKRELKRVWASLRQGYRSEDATGMAYWFDWSEGLLSIADGFIIPNPETFGETGHSPVPTITGFAAALKEVREAA